MNSSSLARHLPDAREALSSFLATLLGGDAPLQVSDPVSTNLDAAAAEHVEQLTILCKTVSGFAVKLEDGWLPLLSKSMLGEAVKVGDPGYEDLACELAGQAYGTIRTQLSGAGVKLPEMMFEVVPPKEPIPEKHLADVLFKVTFTMETESGPVSGFVFFSAEETPEPAPAAPAEQETRQVPVSPLAFPDLGNESLSNNGGHSFGLLSEVELEVSVELGRRRLPLADILRLTTGSVIELEKLVGEPLELYANGRFIAEGEAVVIDEQFGIRITSLAASRHKEKMFR